MGFLLPPQARADFERLFKQNAVVSMQWSLCALCTCAASCGEDEGERSICSCLGSTFGSRAAAYDGLCVQSQPAVISCNRAVTMRPAGHALGALKVGAVSATAAGIGVAHCGWRSLLFTAIWHAVKVLGTEGDGISADMLRSADLAVRY